MKLLLRETFRRPGRTLLTLLGIVIGVQSLVAIPVTIQTTRRAYQALFAGVGGSASLEIVAHGGGGFDGAVAGRVAALDGVEVVLPAVQGPAALRAASGATPVFLVGAEPAALQRLRPHDIVDGSALQGAGVLVQLEFAQAQELTVGAPLDLLTPSGLQQRTLSGVVRLRGPGAGNAATVVLAELQDARSLFGLAGEVNVLHVVLGAGADEQRVAESLREVLPAGLDVQTPQSRAHLAGRGLASTEQLLATLSVIALATGAFVILNSFLMNVGERRKQLAILRCLGATPRQTTALLLREAAVLGLVGTLLGIPLGIAAAHVMMVFMAQLLAVPMPAPQITAGPLVLAGVLGPGVALLATVWPARAAGRRPPLEALCQRPAPPSGAAARWTLRAGVLVLGAGGLCVVGILMDLLPKQVFVYLLPALMTLGVCGCAALIPWIVPPLSAVAERLLRPLLGMEARLAVRQLGRHPVRTALVVSVLAVSVLASVAFGNAILISIDDVHDWCDRVIDSDFIVRGHLPEPSAVLTASMPESLEDELRAIAGIQRVHKLAFVPTAAEGLQSLVLARSWDGGGALGIDLVAGKPEEVQSRLLEGQVVIGSHLAQQRDLKIGDTLDLQTRQGPQTLTVAGVATEYTSGGTVMYMEWSRAVAMLRPEGVHVFMIDAQRPVPAELPAAMAAWCKQHGLTLQSRGDFRAQLDDMMAGVIGSFWGLMGLVFVVASLGVTNALTMNVLEQTREIGILRAVAMTRIQVCKMVLAQALVIGLVSVVPGVVVGAATGLLVLASTYPITGLVYEFDLRLPVVGASMLLAVVVAALAALPPMLRVARLSVVRALQYE